MTEEIERRLRREPGARERGYVPPTLPTSLPDVARPDGARRPWRIAMAVSGVAATMVLAVVAVAFVGGALRGLGGGNGGIGSGGSLSAGPSATSTVATQPSPTPAPSTGTVACMPVDFAVSAAAWDAAAGSRGTTVVLRLVASASACTIGGSPAAGIDSADGSALVRVDARSGKQITLQAGDMVSLAISWSNWCGAAPTQPLAAWLVLPGGDATSAADRIPVAAPSGQQVPVPPCNGPGQPASLNVTEFAPYAGPVPQG